MTPRRPARTDARLCGCVVTGLAASMLLWGPSLWAQEIERPVAFDTDARVPSLDPGLVRRFGLEAPVWPVTDDFVEARLLSVDSGGHVLSVERRDGSVARYPISAQGVAAIRAQIDYALQLTGAVVVEARPEETLSEPAGGAFVRNQMALTWLVYGPLLATLAHDDRTGTSLYLLATGASYFATTALSRNARVTRAQNLLASDGALRGWGAAAGMVFALAGDDASRDAYAAFGLAGALAGAVTGYRFGRGLTDSEAQAAATLSTLAAATTLGLAGTLDLFDDEWSRPVVAGVVGVGLAAYVLGPRYPRTSEYAVTQGDVQMLMLGAVLGAAAGMTPVVEADVDESVGFGIVTVSMVAGTAIAENVWVRRYDHTMSDRNQIALGLLAGGLVGGSLAVMADAPPRGMMVLTTGGALAGTIAGHHMAAPQPAGAVADFGSGDEGSAALGRFRLDPGALALTVARVPGSHALLSVVF